MHYRPREGSFISFDVLCTYPVFVVLFPLYHYKGVCDGLRVAGACLMLAKKQKMEFRFVLDVPLCDLKSRMNNDRIHSSFNG